MTAVDVRLFGNEIYTVTLDGWTGPDPDAVEYLNLAYPRNDTLASNVVTWAAHLAASQMKGEVIAVRDIPDSNDPGEESLPDALAPKPKR
ncbi:hypothetical protein J8F10_13520 [Gemmata sp. G18]|uniref:Uncharacterized protein n=1 Tax=Gemmata palustris TaxID=2822762 RepID=A0ABS5BRE6_9BACT|nr:hypothetical protein [Gemmata palustris]MBP3956304.1 hypothetical protein [Gemmata palustris]